MGTLQRLTAEERKLGWQVACAVSAAQYVARRKAGVPGPASTDAEFLKALHLRNNTFKGLGKKVVVDSLPAAVIEYLKEGETDPDIADALDRLRRTMEGTAEKLLDLGVVRVLKDTSAMTTTQRQALSAFKFIVQLRADLVCAASQKDAENRRQHSVARWIGSYYKILASAFQKMSEYRIRNAQPADDCIDRALVVLENRLFPADAEEEDESADDAGSDEEEASSDDNASDDGAAAGPSSASANRSPSSPPRRASYFVPIAPPASSSPASSPSNTPVTRQRTPTPPPPLPSSPTQRSFPATLAARVTSLLSRLPSLSLWRGSGRRSSSFSAAPPSPSSPSSSGAVSLPSSPTRTFSFASASPSPSTSRGRPSASLQPPPSPTSGDPRPSDKASLTEFIRGIVERPSWAVPSEKPYEVGQHFFSSEKWGGPGPAQGEGMSGMIDAQRRRAKVAFPEEPDKYEMFNGYDEVILAALVCLPDIRLRLNAVESWSGAYFQAPEDEKKAIRLFCGFARVFHQAKYKKICTLDLVDTLASVLPDLVGRVQHGHPASFLEFTWQLFHTFGIFDQSLLSIRQELKCDRCRQRGTAHCDVVVLKVPTSAEECAADGPRQPRRVPTAVTFQDLLDMWAEFRYVDYSPDAQPPACGRCQADRYMRARRYVEKMPPIIFMEFYLYGRLNNYCPARFKMPAGRTNLAAALGCKVANAAARFYQPAALVLHRGYDKYGGHLTATTPRDPGTSWTTARAAAPTRFISPPQTGRWELGPSQVSQSRLEAEPTWGRPVLMVFTAEKEPLPDSRYASDAAAWAQRSEDTSFIVTRTDFADDEDAPSLAPRPGVQRGNLPIPLAKRARTDK